MHAATPVHAALTHAAHASDVFCALRVSGRWNVLDGSIVTMSIIEMLITILLADTGINLSFLRMLRLLRLLRLLKAWPALYKIVVTFGKALPQLGNIFVLMFLIMVRELVSIPRLSSAASASASATDP